MLKNSKNKKYGIDFSTYEKDPVAGEIELKPMQIVHTPMGTSVKPAKFGISDRVTTSQKVDMENIEIPEGIELTVMNIIGDDMYGLIGPNNLSVRLHGSYLEKSKKGNIGEL